MSTALTSMKGVVFFNSSMAYPGFTLFTPLNGTGVWLIDMEGRFVHYWETGYRPGCIGELLSNGNLLYAGKVEDGPLVDLEGAGGVILELDWDGNVLWQYNDPYLHHAFHRMKNGNTLVLKWIQVPEDIAARVAGGDPGTEREGIMWGDVIQEIRTDGNVAWEWIAHEHLKPEEDATCFVCPRSEWTHANACSELPDGNILTSFMKTNTIAIIDKSTSDIKWQWGKGEIAHQHAPSMLDNGNILLFDNGFHQNGFPMGCSRVLEVDPESGKIVWLYDGGYRSRHSFYSSTMSSCQRLPNGNTFICEGTTGRLFEVTSRGELVWEYMNHLPSYEPTPVTEKPCMVYTAYRHEINYAGLKRPFKISTGKPPAPDQKKPDTKKPKGFLKTRIEPMYY